MLFLGFFLGTVELTLWVVFYTFRANIRRSVGYEAEGEADLIAASVVIAVDLLVNTLLICGANKDYSGRRKDLRSVSQVFAISHKAILKFHLVS